MVAGVAIAPYFSAGLGVGVWHSLWPPPRLHARHENPSPEASVLTRFLRAMPFALVVFTRSRPDSHFICIARLAAAFDQSAFADFYPVSTFPAPYASKQQKCANGAMRTTVNLKVLGAALTVSLMSSACTAQQTASSKPTPGSDITTEQVVLPVIACDKHGAPVSGLTAGDFTLADSGRTEAIKNLAAASSLPLQMGLLVDTSRAMSRAMDSERKAAEKFVDLTLPTGKGSETPGHQAFLIHFDQEVELLDDFTVSGDKLHKDLEQMGPTHPPENTQGPETTDSDGSYGGHNHNGGRDRQLYDAIYLAANDLMKSKHGSKALVVFSNGVDAGSKESLNDAIEAAQRADTPVYTIYFKGDEERAGGGLPGGGRRGGMGGGWPGSGGGWPGGGYPRGGGRRGSRPSEVDGRKIMEQIATRTGGLSFEAKKTSDLEDIYSRIAADVEGQYLLSFTPGRSSDDTDFHKVELNAKNKEITVTAPEGYYSTQDDSR